MKPYDFLPIHTIVLNDSKNSIQGTAVFATDIQGLEIP